MTSEVNAEIIAVGTEILLGEITDTNSVFLARQLRDLGINVYFMTSVGDNRQRITEAIAHAMRRADLVITCGGLGPTVDDMTRDAVAMATDRKLVFHEHLLQAIADRFRGFRVAMTENNRQQAFIPEGAIIVENEVGTAPSFIVEHGPNVVLSLPGVPREMKYLFTEKIALYLKQRFDLGETVIRARVLKAAGIGESMLDEALGKELLEMANPTIGLAAHAGQVDIRITAKSDDPAAAEAMIDGIEVLVRERVGRYIFGTGDASLAHVVLETLLARETALTVVEVGVPPIVSEALGRDHLYQPEIVTTLRFPAWTSVGGNGVHNQDVRGAAESLARQHAANSATAALVVASRSAGDADRPDAEAASAIAVAYRDKAISRHYGFSGDAEVAPQFLTMWSLSMLWRLLTDVEPST